MLKSMCVAAVAGLAAAVFTVGVSTVAVSAFAAAAGAPGVKPGLWEMTFNSRMTGADLPPGMGANTMTMKVCITPENAKADWQETIRHLQGEGQNDCTISDLKESGGAYSFTTKCKSGMSGNMKGRMTATTMQQSGDMTFDDKSMPMKMVYTQSGRWLAASCPAGTPGAE